MSERLVLLQNSYTRDCELVFLHGKLEAYLSGFIRARYEPTFHLLRMKPFHAKDWLGIESTLRAHEKRVSAMRRLIEELKSRKEPVSRKDLNLLQRLESHVEYLNGIPETLDESKILCQVHLESFTSRYGTGRGVTTPSERELEFARLYAARDEVFRTGTKESLESYLATARELSTLWESSPERFAGDEFNRKLMRKVTSEMRDELNELELKLEVLLILS